MGSFFGSVQVRSGDREGVIQAAEKVAHEQRQTCLVGPPLNGWIGIYPEQGGQDASFAQAIANLVAEDVLHLAVHDDDITAYWWWRQGKLLDSYWSAPGYFGEELRESEEAHVGQPELLAQLAKGKAEELRQILARDRPKILEGKRLRALSSVLGIRNTLTSFEHLKGGERRGIIGWRRFVELPRVDAARARQELLRKRRMTRAAIGSMKASGLLLVRELCKLGVPRAARAGNGFILGYCGLGRTGPSPLRFHAAPWPSCSDLDIATEAGPMSITSDRNGDRVGIAWGKIVAVWNVVGWQKILEISDDDWSHRVAFSPDGKLLACTLRGKTNVIEVNTGRNLATLPGPAALLAFHPSNRWLVTATTKALHVTDLSGAPADQRVLFVGGQYQEPNWVADALAQSWKRVRSEKVGTDFQAMVAQRQAAVHQARQRLTEQALAQLRAEAKQDANGILAMIEQAPPHGRTQSKEHVLTIGFGADGRWFWCGTDHGLRVYAWDEVLTAKGQDMPSPALGYRPVTVEKPLDKGFVYAVANEPGGERLLFGGHNGRLYRIDLRSGQVREFLRMPEEHEAIQTLVLSADAVGIVSSIHPYLHERKRNVRSFWSVLSYERLFASTQPS